MSNSNAIDPIAVDHDEPQPPVLDSSPFARLERLLSAAPVIRRLDPRVIGELACCSIERPHHHGRVLLPEAAAPEPEPSVLLLTAGWCLAGRSLPNGVRTVVAVARPGDVAGIERLAAGSAAPDLPAWLAAGDGAAVRLPADALRDAIAWSHAAGAELELALAARVAWLEQLLLERLLPPTERLRRVLVRLACQPGVRRGRACEVPLTQGALADLVGASRETVNRSLRRLAAAGVVILRDGRPTLLRDGVPTG